jgi:hypothetical protein
LAPFARLLWLYFKWRTPFSARVFVFDQRASGSVFASAVL